ncbi:hypothetical protein D9M71_402590 [compost metagenome]
MFQQGMLEAAAGAEKGQGVDPRVGDGPERAFGVAVGAAGYAPEAVETLELLRVDAIGRQPDRLQRLAHGFGGQFQGARNGAVRGDPVVLFAHQADSQRPVVVPCILHRLSSHGGAACALSGGLYSCVLAINIGNSARWNCSDAI